MSLPLLSYLFVTASVATAQLPIPLPSTFGRGLFNRSATTEILERDFREANVRLAQLFALKYRNVWFERRDLAALDHAVTRWSAEGRRLLRAILDRRGIRFEEPSVTSGGSSFAAVSARADEVLDHSAAEFAATLPADALASMRLIYAPEYLIARNLRGAYRMDLGVFGSLEAGGFTDLDAVTVHEVGHHIVAHARFEGRDHPLAATLRRADGGDLFQFSLREEREFSFEEMFTYALSNLVLAERAAAGRPDRDYFELLAVGSREFGDVDDEIRGHLRDARRMVERPGEWTREIETLRLPNSSATRDRVAVRLGAVVAFLPDDDGANPTRAVAAARDGLESLERAVELGLAYFAAVHSHRSDPPAVVMLSREFLVNVGASCAHQLTSSTDWTKIQYETGSTY